MPSVEFSPKKQFQDQDAASRELAVVVQAENFHLALSLALSDFIYRANPTQEEVHGARKFIFVLLNLPFADQPLPEFPVRRLDYDVLKPAKPPTPKK